MRCITIIRYELVGMDFLPDGVSPGFDGEDVCQFGSNVVVKFCQLCKSGQHIEHGNCFTYSEEAGNFRTDVLNQFLNGPVTHVDHFIVCIHYLLVQLDEVKRLALYAVLFAVCVNEYLWEYIDFVC